MKRTLVACWLLLAGSLSLFAKEPDLPVLPMTRGLSSIMEMIVPTVTAENCSSNVKPTCFALYQVVAETTSSTVPTYGVRNVSVQTWAATGTGAVVVTIECHSWPSAPWYPCATITNPDSTNGSYISLPRAYEMRAKIRSGDYSSGTISCTFERYEN